MEREIEEALRYANSSNKLEENSLTESEVSKISNDIKEGKQDDSFISSVVELVSKLNNNEEDSYVKTRK